MRADQKRRLVEVPHNRLDVERAKVAIIVVDDLVHRFVGHESIILERLGFPTGNGPHPEALLQNSISTIRKDHKDHKGKSYVLADEFVEVGQKMRCVRNSLPRL